MIETAKGWRRLAAIMFTDMVGYSALSQEREDLALRLLEEHRNLLRPLFGSHGGHEIEAIGDAFLVEFESALEAARCAIEIQTILRERNGSVPAEEQIRLRIGIHLGDVVHIGERVHGDGVNIAARIEPMAEPGGICLSEDIVRQIENKLEAPIRRLGRGDLKNIRSSLVLYRIVLPWEPVRLKPAERLRFLLRRRMVRRILASAFGMAILAAAAILSRTLGTDDPAYARNRVAVLPFVNIASRTEDDYFADGMTEEIITGLSKIRGLEVIARTSAMKYRDSGQGISEIGRSLMVGSLLEGSVRIAHDKARITVQLVDVLTQKHLWVETYDRPLMDVFEIQSDIARRVAGALRVRLVEGAVEQKRTTSAEAYRNYLLGNYHLNRRTGASLEKAIEHFALASALDSTYAPAQAGLASCYTIIASSGYGDITPGVAAPKAKEAAMRAIELDPSLAEAHASLGYVRFRLEWDWKNAEAEFQRAIDLQPSYARAHEWYALYLSLLGRTNEAIPVMQKACELDPLSPSMATGLGRVLHFAGRDEEALTQFSRTIDMDPSYAEAYFGRAMVNMGLSRGERALPDLHRAINLSGRRPIMVALLGYLYATMGRRDEAARLLKELEERAGPEGLSPYLRAQFEMGRGRFDRAFELMEEACTRREGLLIYIKSGPILWGRTAARQIVTDPRYAELLRRIGLEN